MAEMETITILKVGTDEAVKNISDLKENVKVLKKSLEDLDIGTDEYAETLNELKVNQNAIKDAMYATSGTMDTLTQAATGTSESYNSLVHRMAALKEELRATDVSTAEGAARFKELAGQVNAVNDKLKEMDAMQGNFQRNVGNYESAWKGMAKYTDALDKGLKSMSTGIGGVKNGFEALSASPGVATFAILVSAAMKLSDAFKGSETGAASLQKAMDALKPVMDFLKGVLQKFVEYTADLIGKVAEMVGSSGLMDKLVKALMGVGNAIVQYVAAPFKGVIEAIKVFQEQGVKGLKNAAKAFGQEMKGGFSFKQNFQAGQAAADAIVKGTKSKKAEVQQAGKETADEWFKGWEQALAANEKKFDERLKAQQDLQKQLDAEADLAMEETNAEIEAYFAELDEIEERKRIMREYEEEQEQIHADKLKEIQEAKISTLYGVANATADILGTLADLYESDSENSEKNANKIKALRIAESTINTITGAIGAFTQASATIPPPYGQIVGAASAAAVTAAGIAQIAKIKATKVSASTSSSSGSIGATISAPAISTNVDNVRNITTATDEDRLNQMAGNQKVYILQSDIEASGNRRKAQVAETSF